MNLAQVTDINTMVEQIRARGYDIAPEKWYDRMLLDTIKLGNEHYVHLRYATTREFPIGYQTLQLRRWGGLTAHSEPLKEGIPPLSDKTAMESIQVAAMAFGRYMEFTDRVSIDQLDPQIMHYTKEMGDLAVRTLERYARKEMLASASEFIANAKNNPGELVFGDTITLDDLRYIALRMKRLMVKPINGYFHVICSPEFIHDIVMDPLAKEYMKIEQNGRAFETGEPFSLFGITFVETMLDEFYTELDNPGEWYDGSNFYLRVFRSNSDGSYSFVNIIDNDGEHTYRNELENQYLSDGSAIPLKIEWDIAKWIQDHSGNIVNGHKQSVGADGFLSVIEEEGVTIGATDAWAQLPIHRSLMVGQEALIKTGVTGKSGAKMYVKPLGSAGVLDPIDQRQSIGFKIDSVGFTLLRDEACVVIYSVPRNAILANLTLTQMVKFDGPQILDSETYNTFDQQYQINNPATLNTVSGEASVPNEPVYINKDTRSQDDPYDFED